MISHEDLNNMGKAARSSARILSNIPSVIKDQVLMDIADSLIAKSDLILQANSEDCVITRDSGASDAFVDRLLITPERLQSISENVKKVASLPDPVGEMFEIENMQNGLVIGKKRVPLGVICAIYESRPNVTVDIAALSLKSGNSCILRGGSEAIRTNRSLTEIIRESVARAILPKDVVQFVDDTDRRLIEKLLTMRDYVDIIIPRGGADLIHYISQNATMPTITGGIGVCHTFIDERADIDKAVRVSYDAKVDRPTVCNALDTLIVHSAIAPRFLPMIAKRFSQASVEMRCDGKSLSMLGPLDDTHRVKSASEEDWGTEFLSLIVAIKVVDSLDEALSHIDTYGSGHSEAIITEEEAAAEKFLNLVDAAAVYVNASTRFTDGGEFGLGAEVGISTQKFHARGPMGLKELTSYKWIVKGNGQTRGAFGP